ncbi:hypothetical protein [Lapillicoccus jejuensis]|uniref:hypothetical protein n=1 Tax=Lapillicoccus jejuensis TaxID=402171 RepID=UPI001476CE70|nr:hypothetical protein [Lapillicoccus jejuensis]
MFAAPWTDAAGRPQGDPATRLWLGTGPTRLDLGTLHPDGRLDAPGRPPRPS